MENQQEAQATDTDAVQEKLPEYRFVHRCGLPEMENPYFSIIMTVILIGAWTQYVYGISMLPFIPFLVLIAILYYIDSKRSIILDQKGITYTGFWFRGMPRNCYYSRDEFRSWDEFQMVRMNIFRVSGMTKPIPLDQLIFIDRYGNQYFFQVREYAGVGHALSLKKAVEQFVGPIKILDEAAIEKMPNSIFTNVSKEVGHVAYATLGVAILFVVLVCILEPFYLLDNVFVTGFQWIVSISAGAMAFWHMRHFNLIPRVLIFIPVILLALCSLSSFLSNIFLSKLPDWFGEKEAVVFRVSEENEEEQRWTATQDAGLTFTIRAPPKNRAYEGVGTERSMMLYRGPGSLNGLPDSEYNALFQQSGAKQGD